DCPLLDPIACHNVLTSYHRFGGFCTNSFEGQTIPQGFDCEVFSREMLEEADKWAACAPDREHVTPWMRRHYTIVKVVNEPDMSHHRWTLDTEEDYKVIYAVMAAQLGVAP